MPKVCTISSRSSFDLMTQDDQSFIVPPPIRLNSILNHCIKESKTACAGQAVRISVIWSLRHAGFSLAPGRGDTVYRAVKVLERVV